MSKKEITNVKDAIAFVKKHEAKLIDLKFTDFFGKWQHVTIPAHRVDEDLFKEGLGFDGSSLRGWQPINASDMQVRPDPTTARVDPFMIEPTVSFIGNVFDPITGQPYSRDPRYITQKALNYIQSTGIADNAYFGPEAEFFIFDDVRYDLQPQATFFAVDSSEGAWNTGRDERPNLGYKPDFKGGYFPVPPYDTQANLRNEMLLMMEKLGITTDLHHHEVATGGQGEIGMYVDEMLPMADKLQWYRYIVRNIARRHNKVATFMPKPLYGDNGSGMHTHVSLWKDGEPLFAGDKYAGLSQLALHFIAGILEHGQSLIALTNTTTNSYKRLVPGYGAATARQRSVSPCTRPRQSPSASSSARLTPPATATSRSQPSSWQVSTASSVSSIPARPWTRTSTTSHQKSSTRSRALPRASTKPSPRLKRITTTCSRATSSPKMSSRPSSPTSTRTRSCRRSFVPRRSSTSSTSTSDRPSEPLVFKMIG